MRNEDILKKHTKINHLYRNRIYEFPSYYTRSYSLSSTVTNTTQTCKDHKESELYENIEVNDKDDKEIKLYENIEDDWIII